jgi:hypothetical protein
MENPDSARYVVGAGEAFLGQGKFHKVELARVAMPGVDGTGESFMRMAVRRRLQPDCGKAFEIQEAERYRALQERGLPVIPFWHLHQETGEVIATDLKRGGECAVLSFLNEGGETLESLRVLGTRVAQADDQWVDDLGLLAGRCSDAGVYVINPEAVYFIVDRSTGAIEILLGDYKHVDVPSSMGKDTLFIANFSNILTAAQCFAGNVGIDIEKVTNRIWRYHRLPTKEQA